MISNIANGFKYLCLVAVYPGCYVFWLEHLKNNWINNDLRYLHPELLHPTAKRYNPHTCVYRFDAEVQQTFTENSELNLKNRLQQNIAAQQSKGFL